MTEEISTPSLEEAFDAAVASDAGDDDAQLAAFAADEAAMPAGAMDASDDPALQVAAGAADAVLQTPEQRRIAELKHQVDSQNGRVAALNRERQKLAQQLQRIPATPGDFRLDTSAVAEVAEVFPGVARTMTAMAQQLQALQALTHQQAQALQGVGQMHALESQQAQQEVVERSYAALDQGLPGWRADVASPQFSGWLQQQPAGLRQLAASNDPADAAFLVTQFRGVRGPGNQQVQQLRAQRQQVLRQSAAPRTAPAPSRQSDDFDSLDAAFNFHVQNRT
ncbi:hypothetical protein IGB42_01919 [Andreprevotia sp. IGB-42]|uniref:hypothetical protein n=1 Tax=Andreprevotia sp. IGB-42 TaxID=2497473 RepID=UPI0013596733|nr:hypothetical protein [Andreprevotia sp. IGB-42]KAF0813568.1 hypothetical protein IGB42_01919 [Andreprevotia sp. IGB-42]